MDQRWCEPYLDQKFLENVDFKWTDEIHGITENVLIIMLRDTQKAPDERRGTTSVKNFFLVPWSPLEFPEAETFPDSETEPHFYIPDPSIVATRFKYLNMKFVAMQLYPERWEWKSTGPLQECDEFLGSSYVASEKGQENQMIDKSSLQKEALKFAIRKNPAIFAQVKAQAAEMFRVTKSLGQEEEIEAALSALEPTVAQPEPVDKELEDLHQQMDTKVEGETPEEVAQKSKLKDDLTQVLKEMVEAQEPSRTFGSTEKESESFTSPGRNQNFSPRKRNKKEDWEMEMENGINRTAQIGHYLSQWSDISIPGGKGHKARRFVKRRHGLPLRHAGAHLPTVNVELPKYSSAASERIVSFVRISEELHLGKKQSYRNKKSKKRPFKRIVRSSTETSPQSESPEKLASESSFEECSVIEPEEPQVEVKTVVFEPIREKCSICLSLDTLEAGFSKVSCQGRPPCTMIIHRSCMTNAMAVQNLTRKKEFKDAICPTDGCEAPLDRITDLHADGSEGKPLLCNQSTKEKIPESKGKDSKSTKPKKNEDKKKRNRLVSQIGSIDELESYVVVENEPELEPEPETKIEPELKPKNIITNPDEAGLKTVRLEKKQDEVVEKYSKGAGIHKTINRKDRKDSSSKPLVLGCLGYLGSPEKSNRHALNVVVNDVSKTEPKNYVQKPKPRTFRPDCLPEMKSRMGSKLTKNPLDSSRKRKMRNRSKSSLQLPATHWKKAETTSEYLGFEKG
ncbi:unnamed protein product [Caenorhabditis auriculariae]|uniref:Uncharacterized protein n=1 Tax=Caenorhabditis auriculariae TaxID=2777116 RepID=A0A8S1H3K0_9PELO|nr:unnamed protein product [Caenorhabditis auriculariae]